jgi:ABC-type branched-subunit amino acid transport system ATPase component
VCTSRTRERYSSRPALRSPDAESCRTARHRAHHAKPRIVSKLPYGLQKRVELGRALAAAPKLLLLDEPMAGMTVEEKLELCRFIVELNETQGTTVVLIEHDMGVVMDLSDHVVVLEYGRKIADGRSEDASSTFRYRATAWARTPRVAPGSSEASSTTCSA